jgi:hypothetical protein
MLSGRIFQLQPSVPRTAVTASSPLLATPAAADGDRTSNTYGRGNLTLRGALKMLPTPHGMAKEGQARRPGPTGNELGRALTLLPTPRSSDMNGEGRHGEGGADLRTVASELRLLPTPRADPRDMTPRTPREDWRPSLMEAVGSQSNGASTNPPSGDGKPSTGLRLNPSFVGWMMATPSCAACGREWTDPDCQHSAMAFLSPSEDSLESTSSISSSNGNCNKEREHMPERTLESAKEVVAKAIEFGAFSPDDVLTDDLFLVRAEELVGLAQKASEKGKIGDAVLEILHAAQAEPLSNTTREAYTARFKVVPVSSNGHEPEGLPASPAEMREQQESVQAAEKLMDVISAQDDPALAAPAEEIDIEAIFGPGYDDLKVADIKKAVLASAASGDLSPEEWEQIKLYESAHEERKTILGLQPEFKAPEPEPQVQSANFGAVGPTEIVSADFAKPDDVSLEQAYAGQVQTCAQQEGLPIPHDVDPNVAPLPVNITDLTDSQLSQIGSQYHSLFARTQWLVSQEEGRAVVAEHLEREAERDAFVRSYELHKQEIPEEKRTQPTALEAARKQAEKDAELAETVRKWRSRKVHHNTEARELKALATGFDKAVWRIDKELDRRGRLATTGRAAT